MGVTLSLSHSWQLFSFCFSSTLSCQGPAGRRKLVSRGTGADKTMSAQIRERSDAKKAGSETSARCQCVGTIATPNTAFAPDLENVGATLATVVLGAESARSYPDANTETVPRVLNVDVKRAGLEHFALWQLALRSARRTDEDIVQRQEFALAGMVGKGKVASNVLPRKGAGTVLVLVLVSAFVSLGGQDHSVIRQNASSVFKAIVLNQDFVAVEWDGLERGVTNVWPILDV